MDRERHPVGSLTARELEILRLVALGLSNRDIADELTVAVETVHWYTKQIYSKLDVSGRIQAVNRARQLGLLQEERSEQPWIAAPTVGIQKHNLPASTTAFIGRSRAIVEVKRLLQTARLLTLTGVGGTGKTRLALRVASEALGNFANGVCFVDLAPLADAGLVAKAIAAVLEVVENPNEPLPDTLRRALAGREMLLLIDNFEHVIEAAPMVSELLAAAPRLKAIVTSREALRLSGEQEYPVPPLSLPPVDAVSIEAVTTSEAGMLFVQRAQMLLPRFEVTDANAEAIAQICARLDGLPLAIELAASRIKLLTPQTLVERLDSRLNALASGSRDAPPRQQTLRHTIEWSYNLLDEGEKTLFARLAVFRGGRSLEAIETVCGHDLAIDVLDGLASLVDKSLVQQKETPGGEPRFVMLETIHEYAGERLEASGEAGIMRRRHAEYFVELAERAEPELRLARQLYWFQLLELEEDNLRAVLNWSLEGGDVTLGVRLISVLGYFWYAFGHHVEGIGWTDQFLARLDEIPRHYHPKLLISAGHMALLHSVETANHLAMKALNCSRELGDVLNEAWALCILAGTTTFLRDMMRNSLERATALAEEGLSRFRELGYQPGIAQALNVMGEIPLASGDTNRARQVWEECLVVAQQAGDIRRIYLMIANLAVLAQLEGDHERGIELSREALRMARARNNRLDLASELAGLAGSFAATGQPQRAALLLGASAARLEQMGNLLQPTVKPNVDRTIADVRAQLDPATFEAAWDEGRTMTLEQAVAEALEESAGGVAR
jgi:non-specific serine/threonine protein kinase